MVAIKTDVRPGHVDAPHPTPPKPAVNNDGKPPVAKAPDQYKPAAPQNPKPGVAGNSSPEEKTALISKKIADKKLVLKFGSSGDAVSLLQEKLKTLGYKINVNGKFDTHTSKALIAFQKKSGANPDGVLGAFTWKKLGKAMLKHGAQDDGFVAKAPNPDGAKGDVVDTPVPNPDGATGDIGFTPIDQPGTPKG